MIRYLFGSYLRPYLLGYRHFLSEKKARFLLQKPLEGNLRCDKASKCCFWPVFTYYLGFQTNEYGRKQLLNE